MSTTNMSIEEQLQALQAENAKLKAKVDRKNAISIKVSPKGCVQVNGLGRYPTTLYVQQMERFLAAKEDILAFIEENRGKLMTKEE